jgi:hypothetical protein
MVNFLPPDLSTTFLVAAILPLIIGFIVGVVLKSALKIGLALVVLVIILIGLGTKRLLSERTTWLFLTGNVLIGLGMISPNQVLQPLLALVKSGPALTSDVQRLAGYLPYSSLTFILGLGIGLLKG